jgi:hypothetical protein
MQLNHLRKLVSLNRFVYIKIVLNKLMFPEKPVILKKRLLLTWIPISFCAPVRTDALLPLAARRLLNKRKGIITFNNKFISYSKYYYIVI